MDFNIENYIRGMVRIDRAAFEESLKHLNYVRDGSKGFIEFREKHSAEVFAAVNEDGNVYFGNPKYFKP